MSKIILCDIGNTTLKFMIKKKHYTYSHLDELPELNGDIFYISVSHKGRKKFLKKYPNAIDVEKFVNFNTKYKGMGIDRIIACMNFSNHIVIDAGSAITIDIMENGKHVGGFIFQGLNSFKKSYLKISSKLKFILKRKLDLNTIPLCTKDAITHAVIKSITLIINDLATNKQLIFTGGDGKILSKYFKNSIYDKNIIFTNMKLLIKHWIK